MRQAVQVREGEADRAAREERAAPGRRAMRLICRMAGCEESEIHIAVKTRTARVLCRRCGRFSPLARW
jgi:hypothetical protein